MDNHTCPFCGSSQMRLHHPAVWNRPESKVYQCEQCELIYLFPAMSEGEEKAFYLNYNRHVMTRLENGDLSIGAQFEAALQEGRRRISAVTPFLNPSMRVLEIGSATGAFLFLLRDEVQEVLGVEPSRAHAAHMDSLGIPHVADISDLSMVQRDRFDGIALFHVLEHIRDPLSYLTLLREHHLVPGGFLWIEVPNVDDALLSLYECTPFADFYYQAMHHYYFSARTLSSLTERAGFTTIELIPVQRYDLSNHLHWLHQGKPGGAGKYRDIFPESLDAAYADCLKERFLCDTILGVFRS